MSEQSTAVETTTQDASGPNWDVLKEAIGITVEQPKTQETPIENQNKDVQEEDKAQDGIATETETQPEETTETKPEGETKPETETAAETTETEAVIEFKPEDIADVPESYEEGDWRGVAQDLGITIKENSWEAFQNTFKENFVPKAEVEAAKQISKEQVLAQFEPELAAAIELVDLGVPKELIFEPTKIVDGYLALDDAALLREDLKARGYTEEMIDTKMETFIEEGKVKAQADILRHELGLEKQKILNTRTQIVQERKAAREQAAIQQKEQEFIQMKEALNNTSDFMGTTLSNAVKEQLIKKIQSGAYDKEFSNPQAKIAYVLQKELGQKFTEQIKNKFLSKGKDDVMKKLSNVPPIKGQTAAVQKPDNTPTDENNPFAALKGLFN